MIKCLIFKDGIQVQNIDYENEEDALPYVKEFYADHDYFFFKGDFMPKEVIDYMESHKEQEAK